MAVLSSADRSRMPAKEFAQPEKKGFPMNDENHARLAISGATRSEHAGNISASEAERIKSEARAKLAHWGKGGSDGKPEDHKAAVAKMHPEHVHRMVTEAAAGNHGPAMQQMGAKAMQPQMAQGDGEQQAPQKSSPFSDNDGDEGGGSMAPAGPPSRSSMFGMGGGE